MSKRVYVVGVCGGSAAGKTTVAGLLAETLADLAPVTLPVDRYYRDRSAMPPAERAKVNYDEPAALDFSLLAADLASLKAGRPVVPPVYDYARHISSPGGASVGPSPLVIVEGILLFGVPAPMAHVDFKLYVEADRSERLRRRIARDAAERGRDAASVMRQFDETVEPGFVRYIEPTRPTADTVLDWNGYDMPGIAAVADEVRRRMGETDRAESV
jgi:uridine kinase